MDLALIMGAVHCTFAHYDSSTEGIQARTYKQCHVYQFRKHLFWGHYVAKEAQTSNSEQHVVNEKVNKVHTK